MNYEKRCIKAMLSLLLAASVVIPSGMTVLAENFKKASRVNYQVAPAYSVTIPPGVALSGTQETVSSPITAEDIRIGPDEELLVTLSGASNTPSGSTFHAKTADGYSTATYTIKAGDKQISVGEQVASFKSNGSQAMTFSKAEGNRFAGEHSEILTFTISVSDPSINITGVTGEVVAKNGDIITGTGNEDTHIKVENGATITLRDFNNTQISDDDSHSWAGITLEGDATIILRGKNEIKGGNSYYPGIYVPMNNNLIIKGAGTLNAASNGNGAGIGAGNEINCGNIEIDLDEKGEITATGGSNSAGIGAGKQSSCGDIKIKGGTVNAVGGENGSGIGTACNGSICGYVKISGGIVSATGGKNGLGIGACTDGKIRDIIISGGNVTAIGKDASSGIGALTSSYCGDIMINDTVDKVYVERGNNFEYSIYLHGFSNEKLMVGGNQMDNIVKSPFVYEPNKA